VVRDRYYTPEEAAEPMRFSMGVANEHGALLAEFVVPPSKAMNGQDPQIAPFARIALSEGADVGRMIGVAKDKLALSAMDPDPGVRRLPDKTLQKIPDALNRLHSLVNYLGAQNGERNLSATAQKALDELVNVYFYNTTDPHGDSSESTPSTPAQYAPVEQTTSRTTGIDPSRYRGVRRVESRPDPDKPVYAYGPFAERLIFDDGLTVTKEMENGTGVVGWKSVGTDGRRSTYLIGRTPQELPPELKPGGDPLQARRAGNRGEYLLTKMTTNERDERVAEYRFLDLEDVAGVIVVPGEEVNFSYNHQRGRNLRMPSDTKVQPGLVGYRN